MQKLFALVSVCVCLLVHTTALSNIYTVTNTNNSGAGTLHQAIIDANTNSGADEIRFNISGAGPFAIALSTALPAITESVSIRGYSQPGTWNGSNAGRNINIFIQNTSILNYACFTIQGNAGVIEISGIAIGNFNNAAVYCNGVTLNTLFIWGCFLGTQANGTTTAANEHGIKIENNSTITNLYIGTDGNGSNDWAEANLISAHLDAAIFISDAAITSSLIAFNTIGLLKNGLTEAPNCTLATTKTGAIHISNTNNIVIGTNANGSGDWTEANTIAATRITAETVYTDNANGVFINNCNNITVAGNLIGMAEDGATARGNHGYGVYITGSQNVFIGYNDAQPNWNAWATKNTISGNKFGGVYIHNSTNTHISNNSIGTDRTGVLNVGNGDALQQVGNGVYCEGINPQLFIGMDSDNNSDAYEANTISFNKLNGIHIKTNGAYIAGNRIGVNESFAAAGNGKDGVYVESGNQIIIGCNADGVSDNIEWNYIGSNLGNGINFYQANNSRVAGNYIGCINDGVSSLRSNQLSGIFSFESNNITIGSNATAIQLTEQRNYINGSGDHGIFFEKTNRSYISNNFIGISTDGALKRGNNKNGIYLLQCKRDTIGTNNDNINDDLERNIISGNLQNGIRIEGSGNTVNDSIWIANNFIGTSSAGNNNLGNNLNGIFITGTKGTIIGTNGNGISDAGNRERNVIANNEQDGIRLENADSTTIANNFIGLTSSGQFDNGNLGNGLHAINSKWITIGTNSNNTSDDDERNVISNNRGSGIRLENVRLSKIANNYIGTASWGEANYGNYQSGIFLQQSNLNLLGTNGNNLHDAVEKNVIANNIVSGISFNESDSNTIANCYVGVGNNGSIVLPNGNGIELLGSKNNLIGSNTDNVSDFIESNIVAGNIGHGVVLSGVATTGNKLTANYIGLTKFGSTAIANQQAGILIESGANGNIIGADSSYINAQQKKNIIANNGRGLVIRNANSSRNRISCNSFYDNGGPAIDLGDFDGVTPNDGLVNSSGANELIDYPIITVSLLKNITELSIWGYVGDCGIASTVHGAVINKPLTIEVYRADNSPADQNGNATTSSCGNISLPHGEGRTYLGRFIITNGVMNNATMTTESPFTVTDALTAIAIDSLGNTSEFGPALQYTVLTKSASLTLDVTTEQLFSNNLQWSFAANNEIEYYLVQKSSNGKDWGTITKIFSYYTNQQYTWKDKSETGLVYYRIIAVTHNGAQVLSNTKTVKTNSEAAFSVYPKVTTDAITVNFEKQQVGTVVYITDLQGHILMQKDVSGSTLAINNLSRFAKGTYCVVAIVNGIKSVEKIILQ
jgi:parallel beta-helix repeat protein